MTVIERTRPNTPSFPIIMLPTPKPTLTLSNLSITFRTRIGDVQAVRDVSLAIRPGETLGIVGESGCGKSTLAYAVMGHLGENATVSGEIDLGGRKVLDLSPEQLRALRGARMAMVYQDPQAALNPSITVGRQVAEAHQIHSGRSDGDCWQRAIEQLRKVGLPDPERLATRYPHQLSGGQQQRVVIAMALINDPDLLIMDEPTTGLDVTTEALILDLVNDLKKLTDAAVLFISHNLGVIAQVCDRVAVMYAGEVVEDADVHTLFRSPRHPYTVGLLGCVPTPGRSKASGRLRPIPGQLPPRASRPEGCVFAPRCGLARETCTSNVPALRPVAIAPTVPVTPGAHQARCLFSEEVPEWAETQNAKTPAEVVMPGEAPAAHSAEPAASVPLLEVENLSHEFGGGGKGLFDRLLGRVFGRATPVRAVDGVSLAVHPGETLAIVGESGCGKTTLARAVAGLVDPTAGRISFLGRDVTGTADRRPADVRRHLQMVFQNPEASLNPRHTIGRIIGRPIEKFLGLRGVEARRRAAELLRAVQLPVTYVERYPVRLSGGEKQRVSIARAFAGDPQLVVCDEAVSALDVSVQAAILNLLTDLQRERGTSYLFISHDLGVVRYLADRIGVMYLGKLVEQGKTDDIFGGPRHPYTEALLSAIPLPDPAQKGSPLRLQGPVPSPSDRPTGCPFAGRCPRYLGSVCDDLPPPIQDAGNGHEIACHIPLVELARQPRQLTTARTA